MLASSPWTSREKTRRVMTNGNRLVNHEWETLKTCPVLKMEPEDDCLLREAGHTHES